MTAIIDYDTGNLRSVCNALERVGVEYVLTSDHQQIRMADHVLLPGVGEASSAMEKLRERGLDKIIPSLTQPVLGICIGMQLMCRSSEEGNAQCMDIFHVDVRKLHVPEGSDVKVPHMGWNEICLLNTPLFQGIQECTFVYFVHSFAADLCPETIAVSENGQQFSAALHHNNFFGTQFHPEKSGAVGEQILKNFMAL